MKAELEKLKIRYRTASTQKERDEIMEASVAYAKLDGEEFGNTMVELARQTADDAEELVLKSQLKEILPVLSVSYIAKNYFNKSRQWFYQKLNGNIVNGKPAKFTKEEIETLNFALKDLSKKIGSLEVS